MTFAKYMYLQEARLLRYVNWTLVTWCTNVMGSCKHSKSSNILEMVQGKYVVSTGQ